jgi:arylsulfatase A-like enzyme
LNASTRRLNSFSNSGILAGKAPFTAGMASNGSKFPPPWNWVWKTAELLPQPGYPTAFTLYWSGILAWKNQDRLKYLLYSFDTKDNSYTFVENRSLKRCG